MESFGSNVMDLLIFEDLQVALLIYLDLVSTTYYWCLIISILDIERNASSVFYFIKI